MRRSALGAIGTGLLAGTAWADGWQPAQRRPDPAIEVLDPRFERYRFPQVAVERVATGLRWGEGAVWIADQRVLLVSDIQNGRIVRWDEESGHLGVFRQPSRHSNGNARDQQGRLLTCEHETRRVTRTEADGSITVLMGDFEGTRLNSPNDLICRSDGSVWFSDPGFGPNPLEAMAAPELPDRVYRLDPGTGRATVVTEALNKPNGLCFSPDERVLYVTEAEGQPGRRIHAWDVSPEGAVSNPRVHFDCGQAIADGIRADMDGNLWCAWSMGEGLDGVSVIAPDGVRIGHIHLPEPCANLAFGGANRNRLFMAATTSIYAVYVKTQGAVRP